MKNSFYTIMIVPEKSSQIRKIRIPRYILTLSCITFFLVFIFSITMLFDYWYAISQIHENTELKNENRTLRYRVQMVENKLFVIENTVERMKNFSTRLKLIMQLDITPPKDLPPVLPKPSELSPLPLNTSSDEPFKSRFTAELSEKNFENAMKELLKESLQTEGNLQIAYETLADKKSFLAALPTMPPAEGYFTSGFGFRISPFGDHVKMHEGIDIANRPGTPIRATADGEITFSGSKTGYGLTLIINHGYGIETWYAHLKGFKKNKGEKVKRGMTIATLGNSGRVTKPNVHYEVRVHGYPVDPRSYIFEESRPYLEF